MLTAAFLLCVAEVVCVCLNLWWYGFGKCLLLVSVGLLPGASTLPGLVCVIRTCLHGPGTCAEIKQLPEGIAHACCSTATAAAALSPHPKDKPGSLTLHDSQSKSCAAAVHAARKPKHHCARPEAVGRSRTAAVRGGPNRQCTPQHCCVTWHSC